MTPLVLFLVFSDTFWGRTGALVIFILAAISDYYDGKLARRLAAGSRLGKFLDPLADKVLVLGTFIALAMLIPHIVPWWGVVLIALRDVSVTALRSWVESKGKSLRTLPVAKAKTTVQLTFLIGVLLVWALVLSNFGLEEMARGLIDGQILFFAMIAVVVITVWTGLVYFINREESPAV